MNQFAVYSRLLDTQSRLGTCCGTTVDNKMLIDQNIQQSIDLLKDSMDIEDITFYFDLDGLLFDWRGAILSYYPGVTIEQLNRCEEKDAMIVSVYEKEPDFFAKLPVVSNGWKLLAKVLQAGFKVEFASSIGIHPDPKKARLDKLEALKREFVVLGFGEMQDEQLLIVNSSKLKANLSGPGRILVDDFKRNCDEWEAEGGMALHMNIDYDIQDSVDHNLKVIDQLIDFVR